MEKNICQTNSGHLSPGRVFYAHGSRYQRKKMSMYSWVTSNLFNRVKETVVVEIRALTPLRSANVITNFTKRKV